MKGEEIMIVLHGKSVFKDVCIGTISFYKREEILIKRYKISDSKQEIDRFLQARDVGIQQLDELYQKMCDSVGDADAAIFEVHKMMLEDMDYCDSITSIIETEGVNAEYAVGTTADNFADLFLAMDDDYMRGRAADVKDVSERVLKILKYGNTSSMQAADDAMFIIAADDLAPSETVQLDKDKVLGFALQHGSVNSHTAILARSMGIPAVIGLGDALKEEYDKKSAIIDGYEGIVYIDPDLEILNKMQLKKNESDRKKALLKELKGKENVTKDGQKVLIYANVGNPGDIVKALDNDADGIGLFRSEFLYLQSNDFPTEEEQFKIYRQAAQNMAGKKVVIRTLDIGADKQADYFGLAHEENPALGYRAIRICLTRQEIFKTQLRAIYRAAVYGNISIMFPMITSVEEIHQIKEIIKEVKSELKQESVPYKDDVETGIMIETPAAALISDELAKEVDFFSIGTNDLTQYTLAIDRQNRELEPFYQPHHKAILRLIDMTVKNAHKEGIWAGICGELGADTALTETFLRMGIDELSVSASLVLSVRDKVRSLDLSS